MLPPWNRRFGKRNMMKRHAVIIIRQTAVQKTFEVCVL